MSRPDEPRVSARALLDYVLTRPETPVCLVTCARELTHPVVLVLDQREPRVREVFPHEARNPRSVLCVALERTDAVQALLRLGALRTIALDAMPPGTVWLVAYSGGESAAAACQIDVVPINNNPEAN